MIYKMSYKDDYIAYLDKHISGVKKAYAWLLDHHIDSKVDFGDEDVIEENVGNHDKSKWSDEEFEPYAQYFYGSGYSPAFNVAWNHHQKSNPHHWQYWMLIDDDSLVNCLEMPIEYIVEMICDWWSFSFSKGNLREIFSWYDSHKAVQTMGEKTRATVEAILAAIKAELDAEENK